MPNRDYQNERREYQFAHLNREDIHLDPHQQFTEWMDIAHQKNIPDPTAMSLSTVDSKQMPHSRIVLLKGFSHQHGFMFYTHYNSPKGLDISQNPNGALLFYWPELDRQIRIEGTIEPLPAALSDAYFKTRPIDSQLSASISHQSQVVPGRKTLEQNLEIAKAEYEGGAIIRPPHWGGYGLKPNYFEFWQGRESRLHDRFQYVTDPTNHQAWSISRLSP